MRILITGGSGFIGTNLINLFIKRNYDFINFDKSAPLDEKQMKSWHKGDLLNLEELKLVFTTYKPTVVIHLAAKTDTLGSTIDYYVDNIMGTENLLNVIKMNSSIERVVITSTQYVFFPLLYAYPKSDTDYNTHTIYGDSKVITEQMTRASDLHCIWTIIRPTNVWGPWHIRYSNELLKYIQRGKYVHPGFKKVKKSYAYVYSVVYQIDGIINAEKELVNRSTFYVGDYPQDSYEWVNRFSVEMRGKKVSRVPSVVLKLGALLGDLLLLVGINFPLNSKRFKNMITEYLAPVEKTIELFGTNPNTPEENVKETLDWLRNEGSNFSALKKK